MSAIFVTSLITVGASGAIFGIFSIWIVDVCQNVKKLRYPVFELSFAIGSVVISLALGLLPWIDNFAHIGGLIFGLELCMILVLKFDYEKQWQIRARWVVLCLFVALFLLNFIGFWVILYKADLQHFCPACKYFDCIPWVRDGVDWCGR